MLAKVTVLVQASVLRKSGGSHCARLRSAAFRCPPCRCRRSRLPSQACHPLSDRHQGRARAPIGDAS